MDEIMQAGISLLCISQGSTIRDAVACIDRNERQIALVVDEDGRLVDTITDGDVRRAILANLNLNTPVSVLRERKAGTLNPHPVCAPVGTDAVELLRLMKDRSVRQVPLLDEDRRVVDIVTLRELVQSEPLPLQAVVMAGGLGTRLRPLTENTPKTMLRVGDRPLLESIVKQLRDAGISRVNLTTHYKGDVIAEHFGDGSDFGVEIRYVKEDQPLGTAGALSLLESTGQPLLVINGDILTQVDFRAMLEFHADHHADMTVAVRVHEYQIPYGVIHSEGIHVKGVEEKPVVRRFINAGIYLLNPEACRCIPNGKCYDMTDLIENLVAQGRRVISFPVREYWLDIGRMGDYEKAQRDYHKVFEQ
jgi:dTDP-glucose pyrophosphorylase/CBS domain-containing protein